MNSAHRLKICDDIRRELTEKIKAILLERYRNGSSQNVTIPLADVDAVMNGLINFAAQVNAQLFYDAVGKLGPDKAMAGCSKIIKDQFYLFEKVFKDSLEEYIAKGKL